MSGVMSCHSVMKPLIDGRTIRCLGKQATSPYFFLNMSADSFGTVWRLKIVHYLVVASCRIWRRNCMMEREPCPRVILSSPCKLLLFSLLLKQA